VLCAFGILLEFLRREAKLYVPMCSAFFRVLFILTMSTDITICIEHNGALLAKAVYGIAYRPIILHYTNIVIIVLESIVKNTSNKLAN